MKRIATILLIGFMALVQSGCRSSEPAAERSPGTVDYDQYRTYDFGRSYLISSKKPAFAWNQFEERMERELNFRLGKAGLDRSTGSPDLLVFYYAIVERQQRRAIMDYKIGWAAEPFLREGERLNSYPDQTLVIDLVDANSDQLVWRGHVTLPFSRPDQLYKVLPDRLSSLLKQYPNVPE